MQIIFFHGCEYKFWSKKSLKDGKIKDTHAIKQSIHLTPNSTIHLLFSIKGNVRYQKKNILSIPSEAREEFKIFI